MFDRVRNISRAGPARGAAAQLDARTRVGRTAWTMALPAATIGLDHLAAWQHLRLKAGLQPLFAHFSLIRAAAEGCSVARWLCDPTISSDVRVARGAGAQIKDYRERITHERRLGDRMPTPQGKGKTGEARLAEFETELERAGVEPISLPSATELFARYFFPQAALAGGESFFRQISGVIHAKVWSLYALSELGEVVDHGTGVKAVRTLANEDTAYVATMMVMLLASEAVDDIERYGSAIAERAP